MSTYHCVWLRCDSCVPCPATLFTSNRLIVVGESVDAARITAAKDGWTVIDGKDVCPDCIAWPRFPGKQATP